MSEASTPAAASLAEASDDPLRAPSAEDDAPLVMPAFRSLVALYTISFVSQMDGAVMLPTLWPFVEELCGAFCRYQRRGDGGGYEIVPTRKQKDFLARILSAEECFHFSEVGSGKTKVILPLLCMAFLSNNAAVHDLMARGGEAKHVLVVLVPEHLVPDAKAQVFRYCLNLNFRDEYRVYDDVFALLHDDVDLRPSRALDIWRDMTARRAPPRPLVGRVAVGRRLAAGIDA